VGPGSTSEGSGDEVSEQPPFPGLNKAHGFFHLIKRNQKDRDCYHQEREEWKEVSLREEGASLARYRP
jgi:hypothetical protein